MSKFQKPRLTKQEQGKRPRAPSSECQREEPEFPKAGPNSRQTQSNSNKYSGFFGCCCFLVVVVLAKRELSNSLDCKEVIKWHWSQERKAITPLVRNQVGRMSREMGLVLGWQQTTHPSVRGG